MPLYCCLHSIKAALFDAILNKPLLFLPPVSPVFFAALHALTQTHWQIIGEICGLIAEGSAVAAGATVLSWLATILMPIGAGIVILNANETDMKLTAMQAVGYALTAWAFDDPIPPFPSSLRVNVSYFPGKDALPRYEQAWTTTSVATVHNLEATLVKKRVHKRSYQIFWRAIGGGERKELVRLLMEARAEELHGRERQAFLALDPEGYPN